MGTRSEALDEGVLVVTLDPRYTQVEFHHISVQVCVAQFLANLNQGQQLKNGQALCHRINDINVTGQNIGRAGVLPAGVPPSPDLNRDKSLALVWELRG